MKSPVDCARRSSEKGSLHSKWTLYIAICSGDRNARRSHNRSVRHRSFIRDTRFSRGGLDWPLHILTRHRSHCSNTTHYRFYVRPWIMYSVDPFIAKEFALLMQFVAERLSQIVNHNNHFLKTGFSWACMNSQNSSIFQRLRNGRHNYDLTRAGERVDAEAVTRRYHKVQ